MNLTNDLLDIIAESKKNKTKAYDTPAEVTRVDGSTLWVHIPGGVDETPIKKTISAAPGDQVQVRVANGTAWVVGNATNPPTDDAAALRAQQDAKIAGQMAASATQSASIASESAADAQAKAAAASAAARRAETAAGNAETSAANAQSSADSALVGLSTVQDVVGVLNWITAHGTMTSQSGGTFDDNQVYFIQDNNGDYTVQNVRYSLVPEPKAADINSYYVLSVDESVQNYVATHIVVDLEGLWIIPDAGGNKVLIATGNGSTYTTAGTYIVNGSTVLASFLANGATVGKTTEGNVKVTSTGLELCYGSNVIGTITTNGLEFNGRDFDNNLMTFLKILSDDTFIKSNKYITESGGTILKYKQTTELSTDGFSIKKNRGTSTLTAMEINDTYINLDGTEDDNQRYHQGGSVYLSTEAGDGVVVGKWTNGTWAEKARMANDGDITAQGNITDGSGNVLSDKADTSAIPTKTSDLTNDGDGASLFATLAELASKIDGSAGSSGSTGITLGTWKICWGTEAMNTNTASGSGTFAAPYYVDKNITLNFDAVPYVWAQCQGSLTGTNYVLVTSTSKTSATLRLMSSHKNTNTRNVRWFAIGQA